MKPKKLFALVLATLLMVSALSAYGTQTFASDNEPTATEQKPMELIYCSGMSEQSTFGACDLKFNEKLTAETNGKITVKSYFSDSLTKTSEWRTELESKSCDLQTASNGTGLEDLKEYELSQYFFYDVMDISKIGDAYNELLATYPGIEASWEAANLKPIHWSSAGQAYLHTTKPVNSLDDIKGLSIRCADDLTVSLVTALGGNPVRMPLMEAISALQNNVVDGVIIAVDVLKMFNICEVCPYSIALPYVQSYAFNCVMRLDSFQNDFTPETQAVMEECGRFWDQEYIAAYTQICEEAIVYSEEKGQTFNTLSDEENAKILEIIDDFTKKLAEENDAMDLYNAARAAADKYN